MPFNFRELEIPGVVLIEPQTFSDERGYFAETYKYSDFSAFGITDRFTQDNHSHSTKSTLRGLHYQRQPAAQGKLIRVVVGKIFDVAVDMRRGEPTYAKWVSAELSAENGHMLFLPPWCAHGFCILSEEADLIYKMTQEDAPEYETTILWNDPDLGIQWPMDSPVISPRDHAAQRLRDANISFESGRGVS